MATIKDVALKSGFSTATVSRVYSGSGVVSEAATRRILEVAARLDYWPNGAARSLSTSRTYALGVLLPDLHGDFFSEIIRGIDQASRAEDHQIILSSSHADAAGLIAAARSLRGRIDGLIAMAPDANSVQAIEDVARHQPVVLLNPAIQTEKCGSVSIASFDGAYGMMRHLLRLGHQRIAMLKGPAGNVDAEERLRGYRQALHDWSGERAWAQEIEGDFGQSSGHLHSRAILELNPRPTAVFAANDYMAISLISALGKAGINVPRDIAVTGFDDIALARYQTPPLSTVQVDACELGRQAVQQWFAAMRFSDGVLEKSHLVLPATLVIRDSCGASLTAGTRENETGDWPDNSEINSIDE